MTKTTPSYLQGRTRNRAEVDFATSDHSEEDRENDQDAASPKFQVVEIAIDHILNSPVQAREDRSQWNEKQKSKFEQLRKSIREDGLKHIFFVALHPDPKQAREGLYILVFGGHNRRDAAELEGYTSIPCIIIEYNDEQVGFGTTRENEVRMDLDPVEKGRQYSMLMDRYHLTRDDLSKRIDVSPDVIKNCRMVFQCPQYIQQFVRELGDGGFRLARAFKKMDDKLREIAETENDTEQDRERKAFERQAVSLPLMGEYRAGKLNVERIEATIERIIDQEEKKRQQGPSSNGQVDASLQEMETDAQQDARTALNAVSSMSEGEAKLVSIVKAFHRYQRHKGDDIPTQQECSLLDQLIVEIQRTRGEAGD